jgi:outer membrane protein OmpA-like peptidoglycan-associated protein
MSFEGQNLQGATFTSADLTDMNFKNANLQGADFTSTNLTRVNFQNADLRGAVFTSAHFLNCDLRGALVTGASFNSVDFAGTRVAGVDFSSAEMVSSDLSQAIFTDMAPVPAQNIQAALTDKKAGSLNLAILFDFDKDTLTEDGWRQLTELGNALRSNALAGARIRIEGHTDAKGSDEYNLDLSYRRALRVMRTLNEQFGINSALLDVKGYGEEQPVASNDTEAGRAQNRRVTVINTSLAGN